MIPLWLRGGREQQQQLTFFLLAAALWCITHPYGGMFEHDAKIYTLMVWHWFSPDAYARDPFFLFGSQDKFSFFTPLYGSLARLLGFSNAAFAVSALGGALWLSAAVLVARGLVDDRRMQMFAVLCCAVWSLNYSPNSATFVLNETFPTARSIAFPLGALALGLAIQSRFRVALVLAAVATALHPLIGIWVFLLIGGQRLPDRAIFSAAVLAVGAMIVLNFVGLPAFQRMDAAWESIVRISSKDVFVGPAGDLRLNEMLVWLSLLLWAGHLSTPLVRRWYQLASLIGASGFLLAQITSYVYPAILLVQTQPWRAMWIVVFLGVFALAQIMGLAWRRPYRIWWAIGGLLLVILSDWGGFVLAASCTLFHPVLRAHAALIGRQVHLHGNRFAPFLLAGLSLAVLPGYITDLEILGGSLAIDFQTRFPALDGLLLAGGLGVGTMLWAIILTSTLPIRVLQAACAVLLLFAVLHWDQRREQYRDWENQFRSPQAPSFDAVIRRGEVVMWPGARPQRVWHELGTANYASSQQVIGGVFSREKTFDLLRRRQRQAIASLAESWPLSAADESMLLNRYRQLSGERLDSSGDLHKSYSTSLGLTGPGMLYMCEDPALDWVISEKLLAQDVLVPQPAQSPQRAWLYPCAALRAVSRKGTSFGASPAPTIARVLN